MGSKPTGNRSALAAKKTQQDTDYDRDFLEFLFLFFREVWKAPSWDDLGTGKIGQEAIYIGTLGKAIANGSYEGTCQRDR